MNDQKLMHWLLRVMLLLCFALALIFAFALAPAFASEAGEALGFYHPHSVLLDASQVIK